MPDFLPITLQDAISFYAGSVQFDFVRYLVGAGGVFLLVNLLSARLLAGRKIRNKTPGARQMLREAATSFRSVMVYGFFALLVFILRELGVIDVYLDPSERGWGYFAFSVVALIVLHDAWFYWTHRLIHHPRLFRRVHRTHHKSHNPSPWTAYSFDISEAAINAAFMPIALMVVPAAHFAVFLFLGHMMVRNAIGHSGYELFPATRDGRPMFDWLTSVTHHDLHHAQAGFNYGLYFTWWDRLMGTEHPLYHENFAAAVRKPLDGSAVQALTTPRPASVVIAMIASLIVFIASTASTPTIAGESDAAPSGEAATADAMGALGGGAWSTPGNSAHVMFEPCDGDETKLCGRMIWAWDPEIAAAIDGYLLGDFERKAGQWRGGWLANPADGRTYRGKITLREDGSLRLKGCALVFCRSQIWRRVDEASGCATGANSATVDCCTRPIFAFV
ncbi:MAG: sterol desaturase family protein [Pseudomonadota bacterium]